MAVQASVDCSPPEEYASDCLQGWKKSKFPNKQQWMLDCARCAQQQPAPVAEPSPGPTNYEYAADVDNDGDVDVVATFDVAEHTVAEVLDWVERNPDSCAAVREAEEAGRGRVGILDALPC